ncbi:hypothetical protein B0H11DRAFT_2204838 [Mycena galericulata]|nr:hypothetical protein B0H11DRAFT_2204838 [Mycena galericulata]
MWILTLLQFAILTRAAQNYTIDDASPLITYDAPVLERNITAFDSRLLWDGTITYVAPSSDSSPTIRIPFNGTTIYIFVAYPGIAQPAPSGFNASIDGAPAGDWAATESALLYHHLVYHTSTLPAAPHILVMQIKPGWELYFDYAVYTSDIGAKPGGHTSEPQYDDLDASIANCQRNDYSDRSWGDLNRQYPQHDDRNFNIQSIVDLGRATSPSLTLSGLSPTVSGTAQVATTSSNITTIIRMSANPPVVPMIGAFLGGSIFATLVMAVCLIVLRRRRSRKRKRTPWMFNAAGFGLVERGGTGEKGDAREKQKSATDFFAAESIIVPVSAPQAGV